MLQRHLCVTAASLCYSCISVWCGPCCASDWKSVRRVMRKAEKITPHNQDIAPGCCLSSARTISNPLSPPPWAVLPVGLQEEAFHHWVQHHQVLRAFFHMHYSAEHQLKFATHAYCHLCWFPCSPYNPPLPLILPRMHIFTHCVFIQKKSLVTLFYSYCTKLHRWLYFCTLHQFAITDPMLPPSPYCNPGCIVTLLLFFKLFHCFVIVFRLLLYKIPNILLLPQVVKSTFCALQATCK